MNKTLRLLVLSGSLACTSASLASAREHGDHGADHGHDDHGSAHGGHHHTPRFSDINWFTGLIGEKEGATPGLVWRAPGTPPPLGAMLINAAVLFYILGRIAGPAIRTGLVDRKKRIAGDIQAAAAMKAEAEEQLAYYEGKLREMNAELERITSEMRDQAQADRKRILAEAEQRREAMALEARELVEQELATAREVVAKTVAREAVRIARELVAQSLNPQDQERLAQDLLQSVDHSVRREVRS